MPSPNRNDGKEPEKPVEETRVERVEDRLDLHNYASESEPPASQKSDVVISDSSGEKEDAVKVK
jgi:hypothetical protein